MSRLLIAHYFSPPADAERMLFLPTKLKTKSFSDQAGECQKVVSLHLSHQTHQKLFFYF